MAICNAELAGRAGEGGCIARAIVFVFPCRDEDGNFFLPPEFNCLDPAALRESMPAFGF